MVTEEVTKNKRYNLCYTFFIFTYILLGDKMYKSKLSMYGNEKLTIENYNNLIDLNDNLIIIDNYIIEGNNLRIKEINEYNIIILGCFKIISLSDEK